MRRYREQAADRSYPRAESATRPIGNYTTTGAEGRAGEIPRLRDPKGDMNGNEGVNFMTRIRGGLCQAFA